VGIDADWFGCNTLLLPDREEEAVAAAVDRTPWLRLLFMLMRLAAGGRQTADLSVDGEYLFCPSTEHSLLQKSHF